MSFIVNSPIANPLSDVHIGAKLYRVVVISSMVEGTKSMIGTPALEILEVDSVKRSEDRNSLVVEATFLTSDGEVMPTCDRYPKSSIGNILIPLDQSHVKFQKDVYTTEVELAKAEMEKLVDQAKDEANAYISAYTKHIESLDFIIHTLPA